MQITPFQSIRYDAEQISLKHSKHSKKLSFTNSKSNLQTIFEAIKISFMTCLLCFFGIFIRIRIG